MEIHDLTFEDYEDLPGWNWSRLKHANKSAAHAAKAWQSSDEKNSDAVLLGRAVHCLVLTPNRYNDEFYTYVHVDRRTAAGRQAHAEAVAQAGTKIMIPMTLHEKAIAMCNAIESHPIAKELIESAKTEVVYTWEYKNVPLKARVDIIGENDRGLYIADIKTCESAHCLDFPKYARKMMYAEQVVFYGLGVEANKSALVASKYIIAVEREEPYCVAVYSICSDTESAALETVMKCCDTVALWTGKDYYLWDGYPNVYYTL